MTDRYDIVIVGAGMAGASLAAEIGNDAKILLLEAESLPGYHATGRSAAFWTESYGGPGVQPLTTASGEYLRDNGFLSPRGALTIARAGQEVRAEQFVRTFTELGVRASLLGREGVAALVAGLRPDWTCGSFEPDCCDIDVAGLHQHYLAKARGAGVALRCAAGLVGADYVHGAWRLTLADGGHVACDRLVNAAGAWADDVARMAGCSPLGITPLRRTIATLAVTPATITTLPLVIDIEEQFYFKPDAGRLWLSPHDETPCLPGDAAAEEIDVATAIARLEQVVDWRVDRVERKWAGLRSFAPDRLPVYGFDAAQPGFFWFAGQGGFGIQTAPAAADLAGRLLLENPGGAIDPARYAPQRFGCY
jgi:D-arginine dehydrogenase